MIGVGILILNLAMFLVLKCAEDGLNLNSVRFVLKCAEDELS